MTISITSAGARSALTILSGISKLSDTAQERVSSGYRVETAADDASYWSMATVMRTDSKSMSTISDALSIGSAKVDVAYTGTASAIDLVTQIQSKLVSAREAGSDREKINNEISELKDQLLSVIQSSSFSGENWLQNNDTTAAPTRSVIGSFVRQANGAAVPVSIDFEGSKSLLVDTSDASRGMLTSDYDANELNPDGTSTARNYYLLNAGSTTAATGTEISVDDNTTDAQIADMVSVVHSMLEKVTKASADLGILKNRIDDQADFASNLVDVIDKSVGNLVDADMEEESTREKALETQKQMGVQAISILNTAASKVLLLLK